MKTCWTLMMQPHILVGFHSALCAATSVSCLENNHSVQSSVKLQQAEASPHQPLIHRPLLALLQCTLGLDNQIPHAISSAFHGCGLRNMLEYSIVPLCRGYEQIRVSSDVLHGTHLQKAKIMRYNSICCTLN